MIISSTTDIDTYYQALLNRDPQYIGIFYVGVKTTSVFCISTCRARKPKKKNVVFYTTIKEALDEGFRPCKICKPTENAQVTPTDIEKAIQLVNKHPKKKISDQFLREVGLSPEYVRRWFKKHYNMTYHAYQRMYRINLAYQELKGGEKATLTAFDTGYESLSGFGYTYKKLMGNAPTQSLNQNIILLNRTTTPLGPMFIGSTEKGICLLEFTDRKMLETEFRDLQKLLQATILTGENEPIRQTKKELKEYFEGKRKHFDVPLDFPGTIFQKEVWRALQKVELGHTISYTQLANTLGKPSAPRAVARANGSNRIAIMIPCHRIIGKNGHLTGYGGGLERKKWLLNFEKGF